MGILDIDLTKVSDGVGEGAHTGTIQKVEYQIKTGQKWNNKGTTTVSQEDFNNADPNLARMHITINIPGQGNIWHDLYFSEKSLGFAKSFYKALGCGLNEDILGKTIGIKVALKEDPGYDVKATITKVFAA